MTPQQTTQQLTLERKKTMRMMISTKPESTKYTLGIKVQCCSCGCAKVTSSASLKCIEAARTLHRPLFIRSKLSQSSEVQQQDEPNRANLPQPATQTKIQGRKPLVKKQKPVRKKEWETVNTHLRKLLDHLRGTTVKKLESMGKIIYTYGSERY